MTPKTPNPDSNESQGGVLLALAARCEAATGTDRELDLAIYQHVSGRLFRWSEFSGMPGLSDQRVIAVQLEPEYLIENFPEAMDDWQRRVQEIVKVPAFTASLDAAMTLIPYQFRLGTLLEFDGEKRWCAKLFNRGKPGGLPACGAATPALAIAAASLRARSLSGEGGRA